MPSQQPRASPLKRALIAECTIARENENHSMRCDADFFRAPLRKLRACARRLGSVLGPPKVVSAATAVAECVQPEAFKCRRHRHERRGSSLKPCALTRVQRSLAPRAKWKGVDAAPRAWPRATNCHTHAHTHTHTHTHTHGHTYKTCAAHDRDEHIFLRRISHYMLMQQ